MGKPSFLAERQIFLIASLCLVEAWIISPEQRFLSRARMEDRLSGRAASPNCQRI